jgi:hypothetical protein
MNALRIRWNRGGGNSDPEIFDKRGSGEPRFFLLFLKKAGDVACSLQIFHVMYFMVPVEGDDPCSSFPTY